MSSETLKFVKEATEEPPVDIDLFAADNTPQPRSAWQVIDAARKQFVTGELVLGTRPPTRIYLRDGQVYYAERSTDGSLAVRLLMETVIDADQLRRGAIMVDGTEHLGRMFERDASIDRGAVELCVELFTDDVLTTIAEEPVSSARLTLYKRHSAGIDRWLPTRQSVVAPPTAASAAASMTAAPAPTPAPIPVVAPEALARRKAHLRPVQGNDDNLVLANEATVAAVVAEAVRRAMDAIERNQQAPQVNDQIG